MDCCDDFCDIGSWFVYNPDTQWWNICFQVFCVHFCASSVFIALKNSINNLWSVLSNIRSYALLPIQPWSDHEPSKLVGLLTTPLTGMLCSLATIFVAFYAANLIFVFLQKCAKFFQYLIYSEYDGLFIEEDKPRTLQIFIKPVWLLPMILLVRSAFQLIWHTCPWFLVLQK